MSEIWAIALPAFWLTFKLATITTLLLILIAVPLCYELSRPATGARRHTNTVILSLISLPIVLPPTVLGFYLLIATSPNSTIGSLINALGIPSLAFSFWGLVVASLIYSLPFFVQPCYIDFCRTPIAQSESAQVLGANTAQVFWHIAMPQAHRGIIVGAMMSFAHTIGEFGVVLMIGGSISGETKVISIALYEQVELLNYHAAHVIAAILLVFAFVLSVIITLLSHKPFDDRHDN